MPSHPCLGKKPPCNSGIICETLAFVVVGQSRGGWRGLLFHDDDSNLVAPLHRCEKKIFPPRGCCAEMESGGCGAQLRSPARPSRLKWASVDFGCSQPVRV